MDMKFNVNNHSRCMTMCLLKWPSQTYIRNYPDAINRTIPRCIEFNVDVLNMFWYHEYWI